VEIRLPLISGAVRTKGVAEPVASGREA
jgi:hypothetical protein